MKHLLCLVLCVGCLFGVLAVAQSTKREEFGSSLKRLQWDEQKQVTIEQKREAAAPDDVLKVDTTLAIFDVLVLDAQGRSLTGFTKDDFVVTEDGARQEVTTFSLGDGSTVPRSIVLIIDYSGSQLPYIQNSIEAAKMLVDKLTPRDRMAIVTDDVELLVDFTQDKGKLKKSLDSLKKKATGNRLGRSEQYSALFAALRELVKSEERPIILFQTDGDELYRLQPIGESAPPQPNNPNAFEARRKPYSFQDIYTTAQKSRVTIYTIIPGVQLAGRSQEEQFQRAREIYAQRLHAMLKRTGNDSLAAVQARMQQMPDSYFQQMITIQQRQQLAAAGIAKLTGGWTEFLEAPEQASTIYERILAGINRRYILGYYPTNDTRDGKLRKVKIELKGHPEYRILGKQSYYAPAPEK
ncbi:MAG TPA: VWA domain-containing protein [Blastocatellia bacterium]|nr:VWA domain-containing protein [Blastocatellia bacterium]